MRTHVLKAGVSLLAALGVSVAVGQVPQQLEAPAGEKLVLKAHATGAQVYVCAAANEGAMQWTLKGPDAVLHDEKGAPIGTHFAGPTWKHQDGSEVVGKVVQHVDAPRPDAVAWLLLSASDHKGAGVFAAVTSIQRLNTQGGTPPIAAQCNSSKRGAEVRRDYSADYYFYAASTR